MSAPLAPVPSCGSYFLNQGSYVPSRGSYCLIWTSSMQSAGNQPVRPFTLPSQKPPSPMDRTAKAAQENGRAGRRGYRVTGPPSYFCVCCLTFDPLPAVQLDLSGPLRDVGLRGDEGAPRHGAVQPPLPHLRGQRRRGGGAVLACTTATAATATATGTGDRAESQTGTGTGAMAVEPGRT